MLLKVGVIMISVAVALALGVAVVVGLRADENSAPTATDPLAAQTAKQENSKIDPGKKLKLGHEKTEDALPVQADNWPKPSGQEVAAANGSRSFSPQQDADLTLTVPSIGLYDVPVINSKSEEALNRGVIHLPETPMPWEDKEQKNVYIAGHRLGYEGTGSRLVFFNLNRLSKGDSIVLKDSSGTAYNYRVSEMFVADPNASWAKDPVRGRDMVTLQTCTYPNFENRLIIRADRV